MAFLYYDIKHVSLTWKEPIEVLCDQIVPTLVWAEGCFLSKYFV